MNDSKKDILAINLSSGFREVVKYWHVILVFTLLMLLGAYIFLKSTSKTYNVRASIVLRTESNRNVAGGNDIFSAFGFMVQDKTFNNEIFYLQSLPLIRDVLREMDLRTYYYLQNKRIPERFTFGSQNIYKDSPIMVIPEEGFGQPTNLLFQVEILDENQYRINASGEQIEILDFRTERTIARAQNFKLSGVYQFGAIVRNEHASFRIILNSNYDPQRLLKDNLFFRFNNLNHLVWEFKNNLKIEAQGLESTLAHLQLRAENTQLGIDFLNKLIETYIERNFDESNLLANKTIEHIDDQLGNITKDLTLSERQLQNLRLNRNVMNIEEKSRNIYIQLQSFETRKAEVQRRLNHLRQMDDYFTQYKDSTKILAPSSLGLNDPVLNGLINELTALNAEKQRIISHDQLRNPRLATLNISIGNLKEIIAENIRFGLSNARQELDELNSRINSLNREFANLPGAQRELLDIERRFNLNDAIYTNLLERRIQAQIVKASKIPDAKIIEPPIGTGVASPKTLFVFALSIFAGVGLPSGFLIVKKLLLNRVSSKEDIKLITNIPIAGSIPFGKPTEKILMTYPKSPMAESFYTLRSNLVYYLRGKNNKVILVTSSIPAEGKSFSAYNLATSFAFANSKTILVEFDLRKSSEVMSGFNTQNIPGVSSYLINKASFEEIIIKTENPNLDIVQAGHIPPNPISLLTDNKTHELINQLRNSYDFVIIDSPPYGLLTDSFLLMNYSDLVLFVTRLGYTKKSAFTDSIEDLENKKISNLYLLVNHENENNVTYGYNKYEYYKQKKGKAKASYHFDKAKVMT